MSVGWPIGKKSWTSWKSTNGVHEVRGGRTGYEELLETSAELMNAGELKEDRIEQFKKLLEMCEQYRRKNQYE